MLHNSTDWCWWLSCHPRDSSEHGVLPGLTSSLLSLMLWYSPGLEMSWERAIPLTAGSGSGGEGMPFLCWRDAGLRILRPTSPMVRMLLLTCSTFVQLHLMYPFPFSSTLKLLRIEAVHSSNVSSDRSSFVNSYRPKQHSIDRPVQPSVTLLLLRDCICSSERVGAKFAADGRSVWQSLLHCPAPRSSSSALQGSARARQPDSKP